MSETNIWFMIIGVSAVSLLPRILPVAFLSHFEFPPLLQRWLSFVAPAVLGALTAMSILAPQGRIYINSSNIYIWVFIPTLFVAIKSRSLFLSLLTGIGSMAILYNIFSI